MDDQARYDAIFALGGIGVENRTGWIEFVIPFLERIWPRERKFRTEGTTRAWLEMLFKTGQSFPLVYESVRRFLVPASGLDRQLYRLERSWKDEEALAVQHPLTVIDLLDAITPSDPSDAPYSLASVLEYMEDVCPEVTGDRRFLRLLDLVEMR